MKTLHRVTPQIMLRRSVSRYFSSRTADGSGPKDGKKAEMLRVVYLLFERISIVNLGVGSNPVDISYVQPKIRLCVKQMQKILPSGFLKIIVTASSVFIVILSISPPPYLEFSKYSSNSSVDISGVRPCTRSVLRSAENSVPNPSGSSPPSAIL